MVVVLMGVSGSGKTTVGRTLAEQLDWTFVEGDDFHPPENVQKMQVGIPLTDEDRRPWLQALRTRIANACSRGENVVLSCSALKHDYREYLEGQDLACVHFVHLRGPEELIRRRLESRKGHFMNPHLLHSQFEALEAPADAVQVDVAAAPAAIATEIRRKLSL